MTKKTINIKIKLKNFSKKVKRNKKLNYLKTKHNWHIVDPSPWPLFSAVALFLIVLGSVLYMNKYINGLKIFVFGFILLIIILYAWFRDVIREATFEEQHNYAVQKNIKLGMLLFIVSEIMFFFSFFWAFFHSSLSPTYNIGGVWPPEYLQAINATGIPLTNTCLLLTSGSTLTWSHHALKAKIKSQAISSLMLTIILAIIFTFLQIYEYLNASFNINDSVYGSCFYLTTGFHGFHVIIGTIFLTVSIIRLTLNHFTSKHHVGFECGIWYWHFVDVVWLMLYITIYWWSNL